MAEEPILEPVAAPAGTPAPKAPGTPAVPTATVLSGNPPAPAGDPPEPAAPEPTWRDRYAGEDKKELKRLERFASEADFFKSFRDTENKLRSGKPVSFDLPEGATTEEIVAHRKALGIPEAPDGYGLAFSAGIEVTDADKAALGDFAKFMHDRHVPPAAVKAAQEYYEKRMVAGRTAQAEAAEGATLEAMAELRGEWKGREYARNMKIADEFLTQHYGELPGGLDAVNQVLSLRLPNGVQVMHYPAFMRGLVAMARANADDDALIGGDGAGGGVPMQDEYKALISESVANPKKFNGDARKVARLEELAGAITRQDEKQRNRAA